MDGIRVENLTFHYEGQEKPLLENCSFSIQQGEFAVICGSSGCGKTTLLRLLKNQLELAGKYSGTIQYYKSGVEQQYLSSNIGYVMQDVDAQIVTDEVWHELAFGLENMGLPSNVIRLKVAEMAHYFDMESLFHKPTFELSGGQKQLMNLASVLVMEPDILLLDEPTAQLDPVMAEKFMETVRKLNEQLGITVVMVEHDLEHVLPVADRLIVLEEGKIVLEGAPRDVVSRRSTSFGESLPTPVKLYHGISQNGFCPLSEKEARAYLSRLGKDGIVPKECLGNQVDASGKKAQPVIELEELYFRYERQGEDILSAVSLTIKEGEVFSILGGNGSGKTTLLSVLSGQRKAYSGRCRIQGKKITSYKGNSLYRNNLAYLPQNPAALFVKNTVKEDLLEMGVLLGESKQEQEKKILTIAEELGIKNELEKHPYDLSGGQRQRAGLAKILLQNPKILLLDEPTKGLDGESKREFTAVLQTLKEKGMTIVLVTHDVEFAAEMSDRCGIFFDHQLIAEGTPREVFSKNRFFTTPASRLMRPYGIDAITTKEVIACYQS